MDVIKTTLKKRTIERIFTHVRRLYVRQYLSWTDCMDIQLLIYATDRNSNMFYLGGDWIFPDDINCGLNIIQDMDRVKKLNVNKF